MIIMQVMGLSLDSSAKTPIVLLQSTKDQSILPIWVGAMEAMSISLALSEQSLPRPLTHDLLLTVIQALDANVHALEIHSFENGTFFADLLVRHGDIMHKIDCRPSDGIALALRTATPIAVNEEVLQKAQHMAQVQDGTSFQLLKGEVEEAETKEPAKLMTKIVQQIQKKPAPKPSVLNKVNTTQDEDELKELLQSLEPQSTRRM